MVALAALARSVARALTAPVDGASLAVVRFAFGAIVVWEVFRYVDRGWIARYYLDAPMQFTYLIAPWLRPLPGIGMYVGFGVLAVAGLALAVGAWTRIAAAVVALALAYAFLLEQSRYLNHGYLMVLVALLLVVVPTGRTWSVDARRRGRDRPAPFWAVVALRFQAGVVYAFAGLAKIHPDWLAGRPLDRWLRGHDAVPVLGWATSLPAAPLLFAWGGLLLDLLAVPLLLWRPTRLPAFLALAAFHASNDQLFSIGVFPTLAVALTTVFFRPDWPRALRWTRLRTTPAVAAPRTVRVARRTGLAESAALAFAAVFAVVQVALPLRHHAYPTDVTWSEDGRRFAWRMMLRSKQGDLRLVIVDRDDGSSRTVHARDLVASWQHGQVSTRPDLIQQLAHDVHRSEATAGRDVAVHALAFVALNGRPPRMLIDPTVDLAATPRTWANAPWVLPYRP
ncbi:MAG: HTTM domain-containing protein [Trueperaceae bacterium]|nr:HTTM domain-containing protein [Trueperaceae bacterium]